METDHLIIHIREQMKHLTKNEQHIAQFILEHPEKVLEMSAQILGDVTKTSSATVIRCAHKLGFKGFVDLKLSLSRNLPQHETHNYKEITQDEPPREIKRKLLSRAAYTLETTESLLEDQVLEALVEKLYDVQKIVVFGVGASHIVAEDIYQKFTRAGVEVIQSADAHVLATVLAGDHKKGNVLFIGISNSGHNKETLRLAQIARYYGATVAAITSKSDSKLAREANIVLLHDASSEQSLRLAATSSLIAQLMTVDILFYTYLSKDYQTHVAHLSETKKAVEMYIDSSQ
ncbi:MurR/RpiR family transcriptional regulator [Staphylococcus condimenti]|uniref:MurR/RpiR family transcriptional regulator n=1 Tax=Staphylococcus condimenti TaxID=70255 RepID=A0A4Q7CV74_9STAP|nr:MurR/RpiR family transcriptional regulator [Staphylococcus condimenti]RZI03207.1 MurR/RpiR family transcriptional regulator [Staphylococcus condimenti]RZI04896.1 MurR/RpiR family transcriptional regulator [Staphylococcus condimenti]